MNPTQPSSRSSRGSSDRSPSQEGDHEEILAQLREIAATLRQLLEEIRRLPHVEAL